MTGCGVVVMSLGWLANSGWAKASTSQVAALLGERG